MIKAAPLALGVLMATLTHLACRPSDPSMTIEVPLLFVATEDGKQALAGVGIDVQGVPRSSTDEGGIARLQVRGAVGELVTLKAHCPTGFRPAAPLAPLRLQRFLLRRDARAEAASSNLRFEVRCAPQRRHAVLVARLQDAQHQPLAGVLLRAQDTWQAQTDAWGVAHVELLLAPGETLRACLETSAQPQLRPQGPTYQWEAVDADEFYLLEQTFERSDRRARQRKTTRPKPPRPVRLE